MRDHMHLMRSKRFLPLFVTQFFGAFNDNAWRLIVTFLAIRALGPGADEAAAQAQTTWATLVLTVPLILFSFPAGPLCDRLSKRTVIVALKCGEVKKVIGDQTK